MNYDLPNIPTGQRWNVCPNSVLTGYTNLKLQEKRWWGWKTLDYSVISNNKVNVSIEWHARHLLSKRASAVQYGIKEGTL